jgi:hypothetical protein
MKTKGRLNKYMGFAIRKKNENNSVILYFGDI